MIAQTDSQQSIQLAIAPKPDQLAQLLHLVDTSTDVITHLQSLPNTHSLRQEQNWFCTAISQTQPDGSTLTHHTLWHYLLPALSSPDPDADLLARNITQYIQSETADSLADITGTTEPLFQDLAKTFQDLFTGTLTDLEELANPDLLTTLTEFLTEDDWDFALLPTDLPDFHLLRLSFQGENGQWPCTIHLNTANHTLCIYSHSPFPAEPDQLALLAEFITRANSGLIIGNFELDYTDSTLRYKTSLDIEDAQLTSPLIRNLLYNNVLTMDQYLPGIQAILQNLTSPLDAIQAIESTESSPVTA